MVPAGARISAGATVNGVSVYDVRNQAIDPNNISGELTTQASKALLAALQASNFPKDVASVFNSISVATASADAINKILAYATAVGTVT